jgi:hypothetical protein
VLNVSSRWMVEMDQVSADLSKHDPGHRVVPRQGDAASAGNEDEIAARSTGACRVFAALPP